MGVSPFFVRLVHPARKKCRLTDRLWVVSASLDDCRG